MFYTLFNQINCRVIDDSFNIFIRINKSLLFPLICLLEMGLQVVIIYIGKAPFHIINDGFTGEQWRICIGFSAITFVISFIVKLIPIEKCIDKCITSKKTEEMSEENDISKIDKIIKEDNKIIKVSSESNKKLKKVDNYDEINIPMGKILSIHSKENNSQNF